MSGILPVGLGKNYLEYVSLFSLRNIHHFVKWDTELEDSLRQKLIVFPHNSDWSINHKAEGVIHDIRLEISSEAKDVYSNEKIALFIWCLFQSLVEKNWWTIQDDNDLLVPSSKSWIPELANFESKGDFWDSEWSDPRPFLGNSVSLERFRSFPEWYSWQNVTLRLSYPGDFQESFGSNEELYLQVSENFLDHKRTNPMLFDAEAYLGRLASNFDGLVFP